mmetsp:Transcript_68200/g.120367  ORF Transcript_68200/g.120367 Transcript_68200/m.120367 type:complete len:163 (+) Transcript_68200:393-881(+)
MDTRPCCRSMQLRSFQVLGALSGDHICTVEIHSSKLVRDLKRAIREQEGTPVSAQKLFVGDQLLQDSHHLDELASVLRLLRKKHREEGLVPQSPAQIADRARQKNEEKQRVTENARCQRLLAQEKKRLQLEQDQAAKHQRRLLRRGACSSRLRGRQTCREVL